MKLGILVTIVSGFGKKGFYHSQEIGLGKALVRNGHEVVIYKCIPKTKSFDEETLMEGLKIQYIPVSKIGVHGNINVKMIDKHLDGLLSFADTQIFLPHVYRFCKKYNIKFIPYIGIAHSFQQNLKSKVMDAIFGVGTLNIYKKTPVLAKTTAAKEELSKLGVKKCTVAPVGLDITELNNNSQLYDRNQLRLKYGFQSEDVIISFVARLKPEKRPLDLLEIFNNIKDKKPFKLLIVGEGPLRKEIDQKIAAYKIESEVTIIDRVPYDEMWKIHYISDYFLNLRKEEIFGMAVMEAVYYQSSVAAINAPGPSTILDGMKGHKICKNDAEIENWLLHEYPEAALLKESSEKIINCFTWNTCADAFVDLVKR